VNVSVLANRAHSLMGEIFSFSHEEVLLARSATWREALDACRRPCHQGGKLRFSDNRGLAQIDAAHGMIIDPAQPGVGKKDCLMRRKA
jgi:hypothetical protein